MEKWNFKTSTYEPYTIPTNWHTPLYTNDMDEVVNCAECGRKMKFGDCYTSLSIHDDIGFGYPVCHECYLKEWNERDRENDQ